MKVKLLNFAVTAEDLKEADRQARRFDLKRSEVARRALRLGLRVLADANFPGAQKKTQAGAEQR